MSYDVEFKSEATAEFEALTLTIQVASCVKFADCLKTLRT